MYDSDSGIGIDSGISPIFAEIGIRAPGTPADIISTRHMPIAWVLASLVDIILLHSQRQWLSEWWGMLIFSCHVDVNFCKSLNSPLVTTVAPTWCCKSYNIFLSIILSVPKAGLCVISICLFREPTDHDPIEKHISMCHFGTTVISWYTLRKKSLNEVCFVHTLRFLCFVYRIEVGNVPHTVELWPQPKGGLYIKVVFILRGQRLRPGGGKTWTGCAKSGLNSKVVSISRWSFTKVRLYILYLVSLFFCQSACSFKSTRIRDSFVSNWTFRNVFNICQYFCDLQKQSQPRFW